MYQRLSVLTLLGLALSPPSHGKVLKLGAVYANHPVVGRGLYTKVGADGKTMTMFIDTGSFQLTLVWKDWLERSFKPGYCNTFSPGCYKCPTPCQPQEPFDVIDYDDGVQTKVFQRRGILSIGGFSAQNIIFGLIMRQDPPPSSSPPLSMLGLAPSIDSDFPSLVEQLHSMYPSHVGSEDFALYLKPPSVITSPSTGALLLGGGDPNLYQKPLRFVAMRDEDEYLVTLNTLQVGDGIQTIGINHEAALDTGSTFLYVPQLYIQSLINEIGNQAAKAAKTQVPINYDGSRKLWTFSCSNLKYMPRITFGFGPNGEAPLFFTAVNYVIVDKGVCVLLFKPDSRGSTWTFPSTMLIGNYFEFQRSQNRIGIARLVS